MATLVGAPPKLEIESRLFIGGEFVDLTTVRINAAMQGLIPETLARRLRLIAVEDRGGSVLVGFADPGNLLAYDEAVRRSYLGY